MEVNHLRVPLYIRKPNEIILRLSMLIKISHINTNDLVGRKVKETLQLDTNADILIALEASKFFLLRPEYIMVP